MTAILGDRSARLPLHRWDAESSALTLSRTSIRHSPFTAVAVLAVLAVLASVAAPVPARAQSNQGSIVVAATILPIPAIPRPAVVTVRSGDAGGALLSITSASTGAAPPTTFVRLTRGTGAGSHEAFVAYSEGSAATMRLEPSSAEIRVRLERLVTAGT